MEQLLLRFLTRKLLFLVLFGVFFTTYLWLRMDVKPWYSEEHLGAFMSVLGLFFFPFELWLQAAYSFLYLDLALWDWKFTLFVIVAAVPPAAIYALIFWAVIRLSSRVIECARQRETLKK